MGQHHPREVRRSFARAAEERTSNLGRTRSGRPTMELAPAVADGMRATLTRSQQTAEARKWVRQHIAPHLLAGRYTVRSRGNRRWPWVYGIAAQATTGAIGIIWLEEDPAWEPPRALLEGGGK